MPSTYSQQVTSQGFKEEKNKMWRLRARSVLFYPLQCTRLGIDPVVSLCVISDELVMRSEGSGYLLPSTPLSPLSYCPSSQSLSKFQVSSTVFLQGIACSWL